MVLIREMNLMNLINLWFSMFERQLPALVEIIEICKLRWIFHRRAHKELDIRYTGACLSSQKSVRFPFFTIVCLPLRWMCSTLRRWVQTGGSDSLCLTELTTQPLIYLALMISWYIWHQWQMSCMHYVYTSCMHSKYIVRGCRLVQITRRARMCRMNSCMWWGQQLSTRSWPCCMLAGFIHK
jgi:hypothetical protein